MYLNTHTFYSLRYGTFAPVDLLKLAKQHNVKHLVLTDINNTSACLDYIREAKKYKVKPLVGVDFRNGIEQLYVAIAKNNKGFQEINAYLSQFLTSKTDAPAGHKKIPVKAPAFKNVFVVYPFKKNTKFNLNVNEYIGLAPSDLDYVRLKKIDVRQTVMFQTVTFRNKKDFNAHRLLRAIDNNTLLSKLPLSQQANPNHQMLDYQQLMGCYKDFPLTIKNTANIFKAASIDFDLSDNAPPQNQKTYTGSVQKDEALLLELCDKGLAYRYNHVTKAVKQRIQKEVSMIKKMGFISYFLMNWDIVSYAQSKGYYYVGRGSGANSIVAYLLRITDVDPIELDLYFERFINLYRSSPPDFDIDFSWKDREDVTQYIFNRFNNVALVATYNRFQQRSVIRELGKVFGLPKSNLDKLTKGYYQFQQLDYLEQLVIKYSHYIGGFPSHLSIHASGIVIAEKPIHYFSPTFMPPKGFPTIQFDMHVAEDVGLYKFDILSQRGLSKIKDALEIIQVNENKALDIHNIAEFKTDQNIKKMLQTANAIGCFYVESPAMRMLLKKLKVKSYLGLVAASSVVRPGVAQSGMMQTYIQRFRHPEKRKEAHPIMSKLMPETYGVMVYQEDVIKVAHHFAGLTLGEADKMRRGMSGKYRSREEFDAVKQKFFDNCLNEKGYTYELTAEVWRQTESFAGYAFAKGHSASYAVESYQCLFLKCYYPLAFMVATINNYGGFYSTELYVHEAKLNGGVIHAPCVNYSDYYTKLIGNQIYLGFHLLHEFEYKTAYQILEERRVNGLFKNFNDFINRLPISLEQITTLIRINAFRFTKKNKRTLLWEAHLKLKRQTKTLNANPAPDLFQIDHKEYALPQLKNTYHEDTFDQIELLGFPLNSPFSIVKSNKRNYILVKQLPNYINQIVWVKGYLIHRKNTKTRKGQQMFFGTLLDEEGQWLDTVHFPPISTQFQFRGRGVYEIKGRVKEEYECYTIETVEMYKLEVIEDPRYAEVRDEEKEKMVVTRNRRIDYFKGQKQIK